MPLITLYASKDPEESKKQELLAGLSRIVSNKLGKPESYVMVNFVKAETMLSGAIKACAFADVRSIGGLTPDVNKKLSSEIGFLVETYLAIPKDRLYINFTDVPASDWGHNGGTFG